MPIVPIPLAAILRRYTHSNFLLIPILPTATITVLIAAMPIATTPLGRNALPLHAWPSFCLYQCYLLQQLLTAAMPIVPIPLATMLCCYMCGNFFLFLLIPILLTAAMPIATTPMAAMLCHNMRGLVFAYTNITDRSNVNFSGNSHVFAVAMSLTAVILLTAPTRRISTVSYTNGTYYYLQYQHYSQS